MQASYARKAGKESGFWTDPAMHDTRSDPGLFPKDNHDQSCLTRQRRYELGDLSLWVISPEDLVLHKLKAGRAQDFIDVLSVLQRQATSLDYVYITDWAKRLGIWEEWQYVQSQAENPSS